MKKGQIYSGTVQKVSFPNKGIVMTEEGKTVIIKNTLPGQVVSFAVQKVRKGKAEGRLLQVETLAQMELEEPYCKHFGSCGGCTYQNITYDDQLRLKEGQVKELLKEVVKQDDFESIFEGAIKSPNQFAYRNKMEYTFGDEYKDGPLSLGMHKRGSFYDIVKVNECKIVDDDFNLILEATCHFFQERKIAFFHRLSHEGYLRHLLVRKGAKTDEILIDLITTTQLGSLQCENISKDRPKIESIDEQKVLETEEELLKEWVNILTKLSLKGKIVGVLHTKNDSVADIVKNEGTDVLLGEDYFYEELLGLKFKISPFSFFQTNSLGAEVLYDTARTFIKESGLNSMEGKVIYDLYSGTGTIAQMLAPVAGKVIGVEIVEEAVEAAKENAKLNELTNCEFLAGDVLKVLDGIAELPDFIVLDPPRDGIHPKAIEKIISYGVDKMVYISCKPTSLARDLEIFQARGYKVDRLCCVDMFPGTVHVETIALISKNKRI